MTHGEKVETIASVRHRAEALRGGSGSGDGTGPTLWEQSVECRLAELSRDLRRLLTAGVVGIVAVLGFIYQVDQQLTREIGQTRLGIEQNRQGIKQNRQGIEQNRQGIEQNRQGIERARQLLAENGQRLERVEAILLRLEKRLQAGDGAGT